MEIGMLGYTALSNQKEYFLLQICYPRGDVPPFENLHFQIRHARMRLNWSVRNFCLHLVMLENRQRRFSVLTSWKLHRPGNQAVNCKCFLQNGLLENFWKEKYTLLEKAVLFSVHNIVLEGVTVGTQTKLYLISLREFYREHLLKREVYLFHKNNI